MKIELKKTKTFEALSEETICFAAEIWIDGKHEGAVRNDGRGGANIIYPPSLWKRLDNCIGGQNAETIVNNLLNGHVWGKDLKKLLKKNIVFTRKGEEGLFQVKPLNTPSIALSFQASLDQLKTKHNCDKILNLLPFGEALELYTADFKKPLSFY